MLIPLFAKSLVETHIITSAFYHIPLALESMKYVGVAAPFRGFWVYSRPPIGMPGSCVVHLQIDDSTSCLASAG